MKLNKKIWVKKIYSVSDSKYIQIYSGDFYQAKNLRKSKAESDRADTPLYIKAPFWYPGYRYVKSNFTKGLRWAIVVIILVAAAILLKHNITAIKHVLGDIVEKIFKR